MARARGDLTRIDSINFSLDDPSDYYDEAREEARGEGLRSDHGPLVLLEGPEWTPPQVEFSASPRESTALLEAHFTDESTGSISTGNGILTTMAWWTAQSQCPSNCHGWRRECLTLERLAATAT